jgi:hypothetical protein
MDFYKSLPSVAPKIDKTTVLYLSALVDFAVHLLPVILLGLPRAQPLLSVVVATVCVLAWYLVLRQNNRIQTIYVKTIPIETYDNVISWGICCALVVAVIVQFL